MEIISALVISLIIHIPVIFDIIALKYLLKKYSISSKQIILITIFSLFIWTFLASLASMGTEFSYFVLPRGYTPKDMTMGKLLVLTPFLNVIPAAIAALLFRRATRQTGKYTFKVLFPLTLLARVIAAFVWLGGFSLLAWL